MSPITSAAGRYNQWMRNTADVVIVGGGCMGCSLAWHLAQRGLTNVVLIEREAQLAAGSTGKNAGGVRHQFSHPANISLSIESIAMMADFEARVGTPIDFHQDGYLFLVSKTSNVASLPAQHRAAAAAWASTCSGSRPEDAVAIAPGIDIDGRPRRRVVRRRRRGRSERRDDGVREGRAGARRGDRARDRGDRREPRRPPVAEVQTSTGNISTPVAGERRRPVGQGHRALLRRGRAGRARAAAHLHRHARARRIVGRAGVGRPHAPLARARHRLREHVLLPPRGPRPALRHGRPRRATRASTSPCAGTSCRR